MIDTGFGIFVSSIEIICNAIEKQQFSELQNGEITNDFLLFPAEYQPTEILYLGEAVSLITKVKGDFGNEENRREPYGCVFVDNIDKKWVFAASQIIDDFAYDIQRNWIDLYFKDEDDNPEWLIEDNIELIKNFLKLCRLAVESGKDLLHVWIL